MAAGSILTNKYAEGYPKKRYYGGCEYVDGVENLAKSRLKKLFNAKYVNVHHCFGVEMAQAVGEAEVEQVLQPTAFGAGT